jgi:hypothetical protein
MILENEVWVGCKYGWVEILCKKGAGVRSEAKPNEHKESRLK